MKLSQLLNESVSEAALAAWLKKEQFADLNDGHIKREGNTWKCPTNWGEIEIGIGKDGIDILFNDEGSGLERGIGFTSSSKPCTIDSNPPGKLGKLWGRKFYFQNYFNNVSLLPISCSCLYLGSKRIKSLKGISKSVKEVGSLVIGVRSDPNLSGLLELAVLNYLKPFPVTCGSSVDKKSTLYAAVMMIGAHLKEHGSGKKVLDLRKKMIDAGLEKHL